MSQLSIRCLESTADFLAIREQWNDLLNRSQCNTIFMSWEWQYTWWQNLAEKRSLAIFVIHDGDQLIALAPMAMRPPDFARLVPFKALEILGAGNVGSDYLSIIVREGFENQALSMLGSRLMSNNSVIEFSNTERSSGIMTMAALKMQKNGCQTFRHTQSFSPYIDLSSHTWSSYIAPKAARFNKKYRRLKKEFDVRLVQTESEEKRGEDLDILIGLHLKRWDGRGGSNAFDSENLRKFHHAFTALALEKKWLRLFTLWLDDRPAASVYGFFYQNTYYYYQAGFDPSYSQFSVGYLAVGLIIQQAFEEGATEFDMLRGEEEYKYTWANNEREIVRLSIFPPSLKGYLCARTMEVRKSIKYIVNRRANSGSSARHQAAS
ncbi:MAG: GNAT family N-acetyltransferase [Pseudohongiella sp.]|nr:GNAT family N-acetyltransferase [Pseudohongiella sp.]